MKKIFGIILILVLIYSTALAATQTSISLSFTGDCTLGSQEHTQESENSFVYAIRKRGYDFPFKNFKSFFAEDDISLINFEGTLYNRVWNKQEKTYNFRAPLDFAQILTRNSIELAFLGNNHIMDYGKAGMNSTLNTLAKYGVNSFGILPLHQSTYVFDKNGIKIGFTGVYTGHRNMAKEAFEQSFKYLKDEGCKYIIASLHGGTEYARHIDFLQKSTAHAMIDLGADIVIGHHPHIIQGIEQYKDKYILYSLGNFVFGGNPNVRSEDAIIARLNLSFDENSNLLAEDINIIPIHPSGNKDYNNYQPIFTTVSKAREILSHIKFMSENKNFSLGGNINFKEVFDAKGNLWGRLIK